MKRFILFIVSLASSISVFGCDCKTYSNLEVTQNVFYSESDYIFIGRVSVLKADWSYVFEVVEVLKGTGKSQVRGEAWSNCSITPSYIGEYWLVYSFDSSNQTVDLNVCSLSRSLTEPLYSVANRDFPSFPPPKPDASEAEIKKMKTDFEVWEKTALKRARKELLQEIIWLRQKRPLWVSKHPLEDVTGRYPDYGLSE